MGNQVGKSDEIACQNCDLDPDRPERYLKRRSRAYRRSKSLSVSRSESDDILFLVETEPNNVWRVPAQRRILEENNPVFKTMFSEIWQPEGQISISDVDGRGFENLIKFLHSETIDLRSVHTAVATLHASQRYLCTELTECCVDYLGKNLTVSNVLQVLQHVLLYCPLGCRLEYRETSSQSECRIFPTAPPIQELCDQPQDGLNFCSMLVKKCLEHIDENASLLLNSEDFEDLDRAAVELITKRDTLRVADEAELFEALKNWGICECKRQNKDLAPSTQREILGDLFWAVRYLAMTPEQFMKGPMNSQLLTKEEQRCLTELLLNQGSQNAMLEIIERLPYLRRQRHYHCGSKMAKSSKKLRVRKNSEKSHSKDGAESEGRKRRNADSPSAFFVILAFFFE